MPTMMSVRCLLLLLSSALLPLALAGTNEAGLKFLEENAKKPGVITLESGLQYKVLKKGSGQFHPTADSSCSCHYAGTLIDGTTFDSSYDRGSPTSFAPNQVIKGWTEAMQLMVEGDKWEMTIPSELAYGDGGSPPKIQGGDVLVFQMEILEILGDKVPATGKCDVVTKEDCNEKQLAYIEKMSSKSPEELKAQVERLSKMEDSKMKPELHAWLKQRQDLLKKLLSPGSTEEEL